MNARISMGRQAAGGALFVGSSQAIRILLTIASTIVVARILTPADYGVIAMAGPVTSFLLLFQDLGLSQATIQARRITPEQSSSMFWVNVAASGAMSLLLVLLSPIAALFYGDVRAGYIVAASGLTVLFNGTAQQHSALLNRDLRFRTLASIDVASSLTTFAVTVGSALLLRSYWALWLGTFVGTLLNVLLVWNASSWRPNLRPSFCGIAEMLRFGGSFTAHNLFNFLRSNADNVIIAKTFGAAALGLYDRSYRLMIFPLTNVNAPLSRVMLPLLAQLRDDPERFRRAFASAVHALTAAVLPGVAVAVATSDRLVPFLLGERWSAAAPIFYWMSLAGLFQPTANASGWLIITSGRGDVLVKWGIFSSLTAVAGYFIGLPWGPEGVAASIFVGTVLRTPILFWLTCRVSPNVKITELYSILLLPMAGVAISWVLITSLDHGLNFSLLLALALTASYAVGIGIQLMTRDGRMLLRSLINLTSSTLRGRVRRS